MANTSLEGAVAARMAAFIIVDLDCSAAVAQAFAGARTPLVPFTHLAIHRGAARIARTFAASIVLELLAITRKFTGHLP